jgi:hypothetical protein
MVFRNKFGPKREEVTGERNNCVWNFMTFISEEMFHDDRVKEEEISKACGTHKKRNASRALLRQPERMGWRGEKKDHSEELSGDGSVLLKWILKE